MNRQSENTDIDAILFDDGYLLLSDNVGKLPINLLMDRVGIIIIGAIKGMMPLDIDRNGVRVSAKETMRIVWMIEKCTTAGGVC